MNCKNCGAKLNDDDLFCGECGTPVNREPQPESNSENSFNPYSEENIQESAQPEKSIADEAPQNGDIQPENDSEKRFDSYSGEYKEPDESQQTRVFQQPRVPQQPAAPVRPVQNGNVQPSGAYTGQPQNVPPNTQRNKITFNLSKSKMKTIAIILAAVIVAVVALIVGLKIYSNHKLKKPIEINLNDYITEEYVNDQQLQTQSEESDEDYYYDDGEYDDYDDEWIYCNNKYYGHRLPVHGYDGYAYIDQYDLINVIDWDSLFKKVDEEIKNKKGYETYSYHDFLNNDTFLFTADKKEDISNGDTITVKVSTSSAEYVNGDVTIKFKEAKQSYKVDSLKTVTTIDPFKYVTLYCVGASGDTTTYPRVDSSLNQKVDGVKGMTVKYYDDVTISICKNDYIVSKISFELPEDYNYVRNGDTVVLNCYCSDTAKLIDEYNLYIAKYDKTYTVEDLGEYVTKDFKMSDEDLKKFRKDAYSIVVDDFEGHDAYSDFNFNCAYIADLKDKTEESDFKNALYVVYSYKYTDSWTNEVTTYYICVEYLDIIGKDGKVDYNASYYYSDFYYGSTVEEFFEDNDLNYKKIK